MVMNKILCVMLLMIGYGGIVEAKVFSDKEYGYLFHYPDDWVAGLYRSGVVLSEANDRTKDSGFQVRMYRTSQAFKSYAKAYASDTERSMSASLIRGDFGYTKNSDYYEMEFDAVRNGKQYYLYHKIIVFRGQKQVLVIQAGCVQSKRNRDAKIIKEIADSLWVYNERKLEK